MKIIFSFIFFFNICYCIEDGKSSTTVWNEDVNNVEYRVDYREFDRNYDRADSEDYESIVRPCSLRDTNCIRSVFAQNSRCTPTAGHLPDPYILPKVFYYIAHANLTITLNDLKFEGLNSWKIKEFYINKATGRLVLEVEFSKITGYCPKTTIRFLLKGKEPIIVTDFSRIEYEGISLTLTIPHYEDLQLSKGHVYPYIPDTFPVYALGPSVLAVKDPEALRSLAALTTNLSLSLREIFATQGPIFMSIFLRSTICDFGHQ